MRQLITIRLLGLKITFTNIREFYYLFKNIFVEGVYKFYPYKSVPFIIDCGSHIGLSVLYFKKIYPDARIFSFEPNPVNFKILEKNVKQNNLRGVKLVNAAVADKNGKVNFFTSKRTSSILTGRPSTWAWGDSAEKNEWYDSRFYRTIKVSGVKLSSFIDKEVDLIKLDIEGSEGKVIKEIEGKLHLVREIVMEFHGSSSNRSNRLGDILRILKRN